jgi:NADH:ubiquinone oxidoreductase subunit 4 (subunit M)
MGRYASTFFSAAAIPMVFWLGGYDFDGRGLAAVACAVYSVLAGFLGYIAYRMGE